MSYGQKISIAEARQKVSAGKAKWSNGLNDAAVPAGIPSDTYKGKALDGPYWRKYSTEGLDVEGALYIKCALDKFPGKVVYAKATENIINQLENGKNIPVVIEIRRDQPIPDGMGGQRMVTFAGFKLDDSQQSSPQQTVSTDEMKKAVLKAKIKAGQNAKAAKAEIEAMAPDELELEYLTL